MGINIRYFIITIISIFFALGVGIFIGFMFDAQEILTAERDGLIESLNEKFHALELENKLQKNQITALLDKNESYKAFNEYIFPQLIENKLTGITVGLIQIGNDDNYSDIEEVISMAGGTIIPINSLETSYSDFVFNNNIYDIGENSSHPNEVDFYLIATDNKGFDNIDMDLLESYLVNDSANSKPRIIAVEKNYGDLSGLDRFTNYNITTINNIDSIIGKISLIFTLDKNAYNGQGKSIIDRLMKNTFNNFIFEE